MSILSMPFALLAVLVVFTWNAGPAEGSACRKLDFQPSSNGKRLKNHVIGSRNVTSEEFCQALCFMKDDCISINFKQTADPVGMHLCELNDADMIQHPADIKDTHEFSYQGAKTPCSSNPCTENQTCQAGFGASGYRCVCAAGYAGVACDQDIDECHASVVPCPASHSCVNTFGSYNCTCPAGHEDKGTHCEPYQPILAGSSILAAFPVDYDAKLKEYLSSAPSDSGTWVLCFRGSRGGFSSRQFHALCDHKGPTVTLVKVGSHIFGGYTDQSWDERAGFISSAHAFLFSLKNELNQQYKLTIAGDRSKATYGGPTFGPVFGGGNDLAIKDQCATNSDSFAYLGFTYKAPSGLNSQKKKSFLAGSSDFSCDEYEVFYYVAGHP